ncbi:hypothetical protein [Acidovorax sp.]|uniref:hypothetical protein n=1 Tax=Acidovorax sp. TaxID=1872122 RepID=UPI00258B0D6B|nr:hypothetical protein [Acidovorax sp.]
MSARPHLLHRAQRWWNLKLLETREQQQAELAAQMEDNIDQQLVDLACLHRALRDTRARLAAARHLRTTTHQSFTWGL